MNKKSALKILLIAMIACSVFLFFFFWKNKNEQAINETPSDEPVAQTPPKESTTETPPPVEDAPQSENEFNTINFNDESSIYFYVNKDEENTLSASYEPNLVQLPAAYSYGKTIYVDERIYEPTIAMLDAAYADGIDIVVGSGYRSYQTQEETYNGWVADLGEEEANKVSAKPGHSEHQTGLAIDIMQNGFDSNCYLETCFENSEAFTWMQQHAHEYGFILRYPKGKESITGYSYEPWHYRYVGVDLATYLHDHNLTYDEFYLQEN